MAEWVKSSQRLDLTLSISTLAMYRELRIFSVTFARQSSQIEICLRNSMFLIYWFVETGDAPNPSGKVMEDETEQFEPCDGVEADQPLFVKSINDWTDRTHCQSAANQLTPISTRMLCSDIMIVQTPPLTFLTAFCLSALSVSKFHPSSLPVSDEW
jgi:hypothetical protein